MQRALSTASGKDRCELHLWQYGNSHMDIQLPSNCRALNYMLSSLDLHFRQKQYHYLYLLFTVTEKGSSGEQAYFFHSAWKERQHLQLRAPELQRRQPKPGKALWQGTPAWTPCASSPPASPTHCWPIWNSRFDRPLFWPAVDDVMLQSQLEGFLNMQSYCEIGTLDGS